MDLGRITKTAFWTFAVYLVIGSAAGFGAVIISRDVSATQAVGKAALAAPQIVYDHGQPTDTEQLMLELINRSRARPDEEIQIMIDSGDTYIDSAINSYNIDVAAMKTTFAGYTVQPPLALNAKLLAAARGHSQDMADNDFQGHTGSNGLGLADRFSAAGYSYQLGGENVFSYAQSMLHAQAAFLIDWGNPDLGHRKNLLNLDANTDFREIGVGVVSESSSSTAVGPLVVTQDFGTSPMNTVFIVGVVFQDKDGDQFYDPGEGVGGVEVRPDRGTYYAVTSNSGGYAIPVNSGAGSFTITANHADSIGPQTTVVQSSNVKVDFLLVGSGSGGGTGGGASGGQTGGGSQSPSGTGGLGCGLAGMVLLSMLFIGAGLLRAKD